MLPRGSTHGNPRGGEWYSFGISFFPAGEGSCLVLETTSLDHGDIPTGLCSRLSQRYIALDQLFFFAPFYFISMPNFCYVLGVYTFP